ncbi:MAG: RNA polymerase sigma factor [Rubripirellula sp.]
MTPRSVAPETRLSLLARVGNKEDQAAWEQFVELYQPVIFRTAFYKGLQDADAQDVTQQVLWSVAKALEQRPHDPDRARFRTWLATVTRNAAINALRSKRVDRGTGDSNVQQRLQAVADNQSDEAVLEREYQKELFRKAARIIEGEFAADTWQAFWQTTIEEKSIADVADRLNKNVGSVYAARSRIVRRLREEVQRLQDEEK